MCIFFVLGMIQPRFNYWRLEPNEFVHYIQPWGRDQSVPRLGSTVTREVPHAIYRPVLLRYALARGLGWEDAEDVAQHALAAVHDKVASFEYQPERGRFKGWLRTIVNNRVRNLQRDRPPDEPLDQTPTRAGRELSPEEVFERLWMQEHLWHGLAELRNEVDGQTYEVFERMVLHEEPIEEVCAQTGVSRGNAYTIKWRLTKRMADKMQPLMEDA